jgi:hypothetical protein
MINKKLIFLGAITFIAFANEVMANQVTATSHAQVSNFTGFPNTMTYIQSYNTNEVINLTDKPIHIRACYGISVDNCGKDEERCFKVTVNPKGGWQDHWMPKKTCHFNYTGNYNIRAYSTISGDTVSSYNAYGTVIVRR